MRVVWSVLYFFSVVALAGPVLVKEQKKGSNPLIVPYQQYRLDNGLTVILTPDHSDPLVYVEMNYRVGLAEEAPGQSGMAHLFEHMMFQGSAHVGKLGHTRLLQQVGGRGINGLTTRDQTRYYQTVPANQLEKVLWLESDRMGFLLDNLYQQKFDAKRDVAKNERAEFVDGPAYGRVPEVLNRTLYPPNHPYFNTPFGRVEDLDRLTLEDVRQFFLRWYGPNNATLVIGGDIQPAQTLAWVERYFGTLPAGPKLSRSVTRPVALKKSRYRTLVDLVAEPMLVLAYPTVSAREPGFEALDLLADQLGGSASGVLQQQLQQSGKLVSVFANHECGVLACMLVIRAIPNLAQGAELGPIKNEIDNVIARFARDGASKAQIDHSANALRADLIWSLDSVAGKAEQLSTGHSLFQDPNYFHRYLERIARVTPADLQRVLQRYVLQKPRVVLSVVPGDHLEWQAGPANFVEPPPLPPTLSHTRLAPRLVEETLDRRKMPASGGALAVPIPTLWQASLGDRVSLLGHYSDEVPAFAMSIHWPGGRRAEPDGKAGLAELTAGMLFQGSERWQLASIEERVRQLGARLSFGHDGSHSTVWIQGVTSHFDETLALVRELLLQPALRPTDFQRIKLETRQWLQQQARDPQWQADQQFYALIDGLARVPDPQAQWQTLTLDDVRAFYHSVYRSGEARVVVSGDLAQEKVMSALSFLVEPEGQSPTLQQILQELDKYQRQGPTRLEVRTLREGVLNRQALDYETLPQEVDYMLPILLDQWPQNYVEQRVQAVSQLSALTLRDLARRWLDPDDMVIVVVGDAKILAPELATLGWPVQRVALGF